MSDPQIDGTGSDAMALTYLDEQVAAGLLSTARASELRGAFQRLQKGTEAAFARERAVLERARALRETLREDAINLQRLAMERDRLAHAVEGMDAEKEKAAREAAEAEHAAGALQIEANEVRTKVNEARSLAEQVRMENAELVEPRLAELRREGNELKAQVEKIEQESDALKKRKDSVRDRIASVQKSITDKESELRALQTEWTRVKEDPGRLAKQVESVKTAIRRVEEEMTTMGNRLEAAEAEGADLGVRREEAETVAALAEEDASTHRAELEERRRDAAEVGRNLLTVREEQNQLKDRRKELQGLLKAADARVSNAASQAQNNRTAYERALHETKRRADRANAARALVPLAEAGVAETQGRLRALHREHEDVRGRLSEAVRELDVLTFRLRAQAGAEGREKARLDAVDAKVKASEEEREAWMAEERLAEKQAAALEAARDAKARELDKARRDCAAAESEAAVKGLDEADVKKRVKETQERLDRAHAMYGAAKAERNAFVNAIQAAGQSLAERKERVKILAHELHILRNDVASKEAALRREREAHARASDRARARRQEANRERSTYRAKQERVEAQIVEIDRLNSVVNKAEREMLALKDRYEAAIEARNYAGVQLIDRNDELCILYEKAAVHDEALKRGEMGAGDADERLRALSIRRAELERQVRIARNKFPRLPQLAEQIHHLQQDLGRAKDETTALSAKLEDPAAGDRWSALGGEDADETTLREQTRMLEARIGRLRESLLEKDLVLHEISSLSDRLRSQVAGSRDDASSKAQLVSGLQGDVRAMTRRMMAAVSELSMWQATSIKLGRERTETEEILQQAQKAAQETPEEPPTEQAARKLEREQTNADRLATRKQEIQQQENEPQLKTTAEQRPTAYYPGELALPRPYGKFAPFKPTAPGAWMRNVRKPQPKEIEL